jgi:phospholipid/cholesterol/gamma-HCH transport system ATP-binding protein
MERLTQEMPTLRPSVEQDKRVIVFDHVQLSFDDNAVLKDVSFTLRSGRTKIILGASGSGKSTILKIIIGLFRADGGRVWVNE